MKKKLLVVDDQTLFATAISDAILSSTASKFYEVVSATNAAEGIRLFKEDLDIRFLIVDVHMPGDNGIDMVRQIKEDHPERFQTVEIFMVCTNRDRIEYETCLKLGINHWLLKPLRTETLCHYVLEKIPKYLYQPRKKKLLIVDDQALFRASITNAIVSSAANEFVEVLSAKNAEEGIRLFEEEQNISFIIADVHMPGGNGIDMMRQIKEDHPEKFQTLEVFMACTERGPTEYEACLKLGINRWLIKPLRNETVCHYFAERGRKWSTQTSPTHVIPSHTTAPSI